MDMMLILRLYALYDRNKRRKGSFDHHVNCSSSGQTSIGIIIDTLDQYVKLFDLFVPI